MKKNPRNKSGGPRQIGKAQSHVQKNRGFANRPALQMLHIRGGADTLTVWTGFADDGWCTGEVDQKHLRRDQLVPSLQSGVSAFYNVKHLKGSEH